MTKTPHRTPTEQIKEALELAVKHMHGFPAINKALALLSPEGGHVVVPRELTASAEAIMRQCEIEPCLTMAEAYRAMIRAAAERGE